MIRQNSQIRMKIHHASSIRPLRTNYFRMKMKVIHKKFLLVVSLLMIFFSLGTNAFVINSVSSVESDNQDKPSTITRTIDVSKYYRPFPELVAHRNTSLQKAPAPVLAELSNKVFGRAKITRCWLNLDEMWDYRTHEFNFNFRIGVDKYKDEKEKFRETWDSEQETNIHFYDYLKAFANHSDEVVLCLRRYERDILDKTLNISLDDYKIIFKNAVKHYKVLCPNLRYVEVGNEYHLKGFMGATEEEYYRFYAQAYMAVNEANEELGLAGADRVLVGGPVSTGHVSRVDKFLALYAADQNVAKRLDFVSWHDYHQVVTYKEDTLTIINREKTVCDYLSKYGLPVNIPLFLTEHQPYHFSEDKVEYHMANTAYLPHSLYFNSIYSPNINIFPWVLYHIREKQIRFMWFDGPNEPDTKEAELRMLPLGASMKMLSMHKGNEIQVDNFISRDNLVLASYKKNSLVVEAVNYGNQRDVILSVKNLKDVFPSSKSGKLRLKKYLIDSKRSNCLTNPDYKGGIEQVEDRWVNITGSRLTLKHDALEENGLVLWEITKK